MGSMPNSHPIKIKRIAAVINGKDVLTEVPPRMTLAELLREELRLTGTKLGCNRAECGSCTVLMDGLPVFSCTALAVMVDGRSVDTVEGLASRGELHPIQRAFIESDALQCGFCIPGMIMSVKNLLDLNPDPNEGDVKTAIAGNFCRCGAYPNIIKATLEAAAELRVRGQVAR